jgi:glutathione S-transferase
MKTLYQFSFSHFCEKARWALDYKGQPYTVKNLLAGPHMSITKKLAPKTCVPILVDDKTIIQESNAIIDHLDKHYPSNPLTPSDPNLAKESREWEKYLDEEVGVTVRAWFYYYTLPVKSSALTFLLHESPWFGSPLYALIFPKVRDAMMEMMNINADNAKRCEERLTNALTRINDTVKNQKYLVGDSFTRADLTACSLLSHFCRPIEKFKTAFPTPVHELSNKYSEEPVCKWVNDIYQNHRIN